jgi:hypothetical protein
MSGGITENDHFPIILLLGGKHLGFKGGKCFGMSVWSAGQQLSQNG